MKNLLLLLATMVTLSACIPTEKPQGRQAQIESKTRDYFVTYAERKDFSKLLSFYNEDMIFHDVALQLRLDSLWKFERFYNWNDTLGNFRVAEPGGPALIVDHLLANDSLAVVQGRFTPFYYYGQLVDPPTGFEMTIWLEFDENLKIIKHTDWIEYPPSMMQNVINRIEKHGHERLPDWLDLSNPPK